MCFGNTMFFLILWYKIPKECYKLNCTVNPKCLGSPDTSGSQTKWRCNLAFIMKVSPGGIPVTRLHQISRKISWLVASTCTKIIFLYQDMHTVITCTSSIMCECIRHNYAIILFPITKRKHNFNKLYSIPYMHTWKLERSN